MDRKIILFELNEVPMTIVEQFVEWQPGSVLARHLPRFRRYATTAEDQTPLSPWTTWPSLHRGVVDTRHEILEFGQDLAEVDGRYPPIWRLLAENGVRTGMCGSLHSYPVPEELENYAFYLPDIFAAGSECFPAELSSFQEFNLAMSRASGRNVARGVPWAEALRLLRAAPGLGLRLGTFSDLGQQLVSERLRNWRKIRRRTYQAVLAFDIYMKQLATTRPDFSTFFTNHVASSMHRYWAAAFPDDYETNGFDDEWIDRFSHEIEFTMTRFDRFLARLLRFVTAHPDYQLWIATSMGQEATTAEPVETELQVRDVCRFMRVMGIPDDGWEERPAMKPQANVRVAEGLLPTLEERLALLTIRGRPLEYRAAPSGLVSLEFGQVNLDPERESPHLGPDPVSLESLGLENMRIQDRSGTSAYHIPDGCLLIYDPRSPDPKPPGASISTLDIAPALLANFGVKVPGYMNRATDLA